MHIRPIALAAALTVTASIPARADYISAVMDDAPFAYWRFDDATSAANDTAADEVGAHDGTYQGDVTLTAGAPVGVAGNRAATFSTASEGFVNVGTLGSFGSSISSGVTVEFWINSSGTTRQDVFGSFDTGATSILGAVDRATGGANDDDAVRILAQQNNSARRIGGTNDDTDITDGTWKYVAITISGEGVVNLYLADAGDSQSTSLTVTNTGTTFASSANLLEDFLLGSVNADGSRSGRLVGQLDEFALYTRTLSKAELDSHLAAVPEPASLALMLVAGGACVSRPRARA